MITFIIISLQQVNKDFHLLLHLTLARFSVRLLNFVEKFQISFFLPFNEISTYIINGSHLRWRGGMSHIVLKVGQPKISFVQFPEQKFFV